MINYTNSKIYKLVNSVDNLIYVGSTTSTLTKRLSEHKTCANRNPTRRVYQHLNRIGWNNVRIVLVESVSCANKDELIRAEQFHIDSLRPSLNMVNAVYSDCNHGKRRRQCVECGGASMCNHGKQRNHCVVCSPKTCEFCLITIAKVNFKSHLRTAKHRTAYKQTFLEEFGETINDNEITQWY